MKSFTAYSTWMMMHRISQLDKCIDTRSLYIRSLTSTSSRQARALKLCLTTSTKLEATHKPSCSEVNKDVLILAHHFDLQPLSDMAVRMLIKSLTAANLVQTLTNCYEL